MRCLRFFSSYRKWMTCKLWIENENGMRTMVNKRTKNRTVVVTRPRKLNFVQLPVFCLFNVHCVPWTVRWFDYLWFGFVFLIIILFLHSVPSVNTSVSVALIAWTLMLSTFQCYARAICAQFFHRALTLVDSIR